MSSKVLFKTLSANVFKEVFFFLSHASPTLVVLTEDNLTCKWLGLIKIGEIKIKNITDVKIINNQWIKYGLSYTFFALMGALMVTYKQGDKTKHVYIVLSDKNLKILLKLIKDKISKK